MIRPRKRIVFALAVVLAGAATGVWFYMQSARIFRKPLTPVSRPVRDFRSHVQRSAEHTRVPIPGGTFRMGNDLSPRPDERPAHDVSLSPFLMDAHEVTNRQFARFVEQTGYVTTAERRGWSYVYDQQNDRWGKIPGADWRHPGGPQTSLTAREDFPVVHVSWYDAAADGFAGLAPVGCFPAHGFGLFHMMGNVWEWCADWYAPDTYACGSAENPPGPKQGRLRGIRGGSWLSPQDYRPGHRVWARAARRPDYSSDDLGFRCAWPMDESDAPLADREPGFVCASVL